MSGRQKAYFGIRGGCLLLFVLAAVAFPRGMAAGLTAGAAGVIGLLTCIGVNAGGPAERAGALHQGVRYEKARAPQGDWPPYPDDQVIDGEVLKKKEQ